MNIDSTQVYIMMYKWSINAHILLYKNYPFHLLNRQIRTVFWEVFKTLNNSKLGAFIFMPGCSPHNCNMTAKLVNHVTIYTGVAMGGGGVENAD